MVHAKKIWYCSKKKKEKKPQSNTFWSIFVFEDRHQETSTAIYSSDYISQKALHLSHMAELTHTHPSDIAHTLKLPMLTHAGVTHTYVHPKYVCVGVCECHGDLISFTHSPLLSVKSDHLQ